MPAEQLSDRVWALTGPNNIGVLMGPDNEAALVDTGLDESAARKAWRLVEEKGRRLVAVINTHSHADHIGGNRFIVGRSQAVVYASAFEATAIRHPIWEPLYLAGGAMPGPGVSGKFFMAEPTPRVAELPAAGQVDMGLGFMVEIVPLPGHAYAQVGVAYDDVLFTADAFFPPATLEKHGLPYFVDLAAAEQSLADVRDQAGRWSAFLPGHGSRLDRGGVEAHVAANLSCFDRLRGEVLSALDEPRSTDELVDVLSRRLGLSYASCGQYYLARAAVTALLTDLERRSLVSPVVGGTLLRWSAA
ncbi:MAG: MBL fold metallo-hydrolase [Bacillota bacterium]